MNLENKVIVITGGSRGIGLAMAEMLGSKGARLALVDLDEDKLGEEVAGLNALGIDAKYYICNVTREEQVINLFDQVIADFGALNGLVNNAGIVRDGLMVKAKDREVVGRMSLDQWQSVIDVNLTGVFLCSREASVRMIETGSEGVIVNICSVSRAGNIGQINYSAAKAGVAAMTVTTSKELSKYGIRCMGIAPGFVGTDMVMSMKSEALEKMTAQIPMGRLGKPEEIASTAAFIFENDYLTGRVIETDGGIRL